MFRKIRKVLNFLQDAGKPILQKLLLPQTKILPSFNSKTDTSSPANVLLTLADVKTSLGLQLLKLKF